MKFIEKIKSNKFVSSVLTIGAGNFLAQVFQVVTIPMASRLYSQGAYGEYGIVLSTATFITGFSTLGLTSAIMVPDNEEEVHKVFKTAFYTQFLITFLLMCVCLIGSPFFRLFRVSGSYPMAVVVMCIYIITANLQGLLTVYINKKEMNKVLFYNPLIGAFSNVLILIPLGFMGVGFWGFLTSIILSNIIIDVLMVRASNPFRTRLLHSDVLVVIKKYKAFILYQFPANFISSFALQFPVQFLARVFGNVLLGSYSMCIKLLEYPIKLIAAPISDVYFRTASAIHNEKDKLSDLTYKMIRGIVIIASVPTAIMVFWGEELFVFILGKQWEEAGRLVTVLILQYVLSFCSQCTRYCRVALGRQKMNLLYTIIQWGGVATSLFAGYIITKSFFGTIVFFAIGNSLILVFDMAMNFYCMQKNLLKYLRLISVYLILFLLFLLIKVF